jgi:hypothetical protein
MASRALTKEIRSLVSQGKSKTRKTLERVQGEDRIVAGISGAATAIAAAALDKREPDGPHSFEVLGVTVPTNLAIGLGGVAAGMWFGKGTVAAALVGVGFSATNCSIYRMVLDRE